MTESFLHYVWQCQYFGKENLKTTEGESISIFKVGILNTNAGPDFSQAKIKLSNIDWAGTIEVHIKSSDWLVHQHHQNRAYDNVILHVVWEADKEIVRTDGTSIPTLELKSRVSKELFKKYSHLVNSGEIVPCQKSFAEVDDVIKVSMLDKATMQRLEAKALNVQNILEFNNGDWEETTYQWIAKNFGFKVNAEPFLQLAKSLPHKILQKHSSLLQIEALLFGMAGMLETKTKNEYVASLFQEYDFLSKKYLLKDKNLHYTQWKFLRLRPANFPTLRIAQFASVVFNARNIFSKIKESKSVDELLSLFDSVPSAYWQTHYHFAKKSKSTIPPLGKSSKENLLINAVVPLLTAYGKKTDDYKFVEKAIEILQSLPAEKNKIITNWESLGLKVKSAFDSQALIEQYNNLCQKRLCLNCVVGSSIIKPK